jgi:hypothetical protein
MSLKFYKIDIYAEECGGFGCSPHFYSRIVAASSKDDAIKQADLTLSERMEKVEEFELPSLKRKRIGFVVC